MTAILLGVFESTNFPKVPAGALMPAKGYLQVTKISNGAFDAGSLSGISATSTGIEESDYRKGLVGMRSNSPLVGDINMGSRVIRPIFQQTFPLNFLIDYYLYIQRDDRIPYIVKVNLDIILHNMKLMQQGDLHYGKNGGKWGNPLFGKPYMLENPVATDPAAWGLRQKNRIS